MAQSRQERQRAQRRNAREVRQNKYSRLAPKQVHEAGKRARENYADSRMGKDNSNLSEREKNQLARMASYGAMHKANPAYYDEFKEFFYHKDEG